MSRFGITKQIYENLSELYWKMYRDLEQAHTNMENARTNMENACAHDWIRDFEDRDERSRSKCRHCNKGR